MNIRQQHRHIIWYIALAIVGIALILAADQLGLFEGIDTYLHDLSFRIRGELTPDERIVIVAIDEKTLEQFGKWPLKRTHYARLLDSLREASVVGFDIIMAESSPDDAELRTAISMHGKVVLPVYIENDSRISYPAATLTPCTTGHIHVEQGIDGIVRKVFHMLSYQGNAMPSFATVLFEIATDTHENLPKIAEADPDEGQSLRITQKMPMNINFYGPPGTFPMISLADIAQGDYAQSFFKDKVVLVGLTAAGIEDKKLIPFTQERNGIAGVEVHANILNNLFDRNAIQVADERIRIISAILFSLIGFFAFLKLSEKAAALFWVSALIVITAGIYSFFAFRNLWISPSLFYFTFSFLCLTAYITKLDEAARQLDNEYKTINDRLSGAMDVNSVRREETGAGIISFLSSGGIHTKVEKLLALEQQYEKQLEDTIRKRTQELTEAFSLINTMSDEMIYRLTKATESKDFGTGEHIVRIGLYASEIARMLGMSEEFVELITFASPMHDLGKIGIPDNILLKPGKLTINEYNVMKTHTIIGENILSKSSFPKILLSASIALNHHERWDGTGYPRGLKGKDIPVEARIVTICDIYDAIRSSRPYKPACDHQKAAEKIIRGDEKTRPEHFDPDVLQAFIRLLPKLELIYSLHQKPNVQKSSIEP
ncbi:MAG: hypothetical protein A2Z47_06430 [Thermodesulfovibrio sp. RBG_19FT_COMBO_42_12]|nr:MAG: hypothetical protein A2Z47_06430 [Thermodesulfovibrio sp. RBG_19FT_COMBO_42_12]